MKITAGISEICGAIIGDGWIQSNERGLFITGNIIEDKQYYDEHLAPLIRKELKINLTPRPFPYWKTYGIGIYKRDIIRNFLKLRMLKGEKASRVFIPLAFKRNKKYFIPLLRGIFDTDGSIYFMKDPNPTRKNNFHIRPRIRIACISKRLIDDIKILAKSLGINHSNPSPFNWEETPVHIFEINEMKSIQKWLNLIGTKNPVHQTKIDIWKKFGYVPPKTTLSERIKILKGLINPKLYYQNAGVPKSGQRGSAQALLKNFEH